MKVLVGNIQRFCLDDGPGIRTTVFLKGCSVRCPWCCNPENLEKHVSIGNSGKVYGSLMSEEDIFLEINKDFHFYNNVGGVTFSGGECLLTLSQMDNLISLLKNNGINIAIETSLFVPTQNVAKVVKSVDFFYIDFKILIPNMAKNVIKGDVELFFDNLDLITRSVDVNKIHPRIPLVPGITDVEENLCAIIQTLKKYKLYDIEVFSVHNLGAEKYKDLKLEYTTFEPMPSSRIEEVLSLFQRNGINTKFLKV